VAEVNLNIFSSWFGLQRKTEGCRC